MSLNILHQYMLRDLFVVTSDGTLGGTAVPVHPFPLVLKLNRLDCDYIITPVP